MDFQGEAFARMDNWKLMNREDPTNPAAFKLYNLENDPGEQKDLAAQHPKLKDSLLAGLDGFSENHENQLRMKITPKIPDQT